MIRITWMHPDGEVPIWVESISCVAELKDGTHIMTPMGHLVCKEPVQEVLDLAQMVSRIEALEGNHGPH